MGIWLPIEMPRNCIDCYVRGIASVTSCPCILNGVPGIGSNFPVSIPKECPIKEIRNVDGIFEQ